MQSFPFSLLCTSIVPLANNNLTSDILSVTSPRVFLQCTGDPYARVAMEDFPYLVMEVTHQKCKAHNL